MENKWQKLDLQWPKDSYIKVPINLEYWMTITMNHDV